jgi:hypothetical protein
MMLHHGHDDTKFESMTLQQVYYLLVIFFFAVREPFNPGITFFFYICQKTFPGHIFETPPGTEEFQFHALTGVDT